MDNKKGTRRKIGGRPYKPYSDNVMHQCLADIMEKKLTTRKAAETYGISRSSILLKLRAIRENNVALLGRSCVFTSEEEKSFVQHAVKLSEFGFPISTFDLRCIVKLYLDSCGRNEVRFSGNFPGKRWAESFVERHHAALSQRFASNIKRSRAAVNKDMINSYFDNVEKELQGIDPELNGYVIIKYEEEYWPGIVTQVHKSGVTVRCMSKSGNCWIWPKQEDILTYNISDVVCKINPPTKVSSKRELYNIPELKDKWGIVE